MIVTCASCLTKFNLDDSRILAKGVKVRCSRCKHVFYVVPPPETKEEIIEDAKSFAKFHEELMGPVVKKAEVPSEAKVEREEVTPEEEETFLFSEKAPEEKVEKWFPKEGEELTPPEKVERIPVEEPIFEEKAKIKPSKPQRIISRERRRFPRFFALLVVLVLLVIGVFYLWTELGSGGRLFPYIQSPVNKINKLWNEIWGTEKADLTVGDLNGYEEKIGETSLFIIEGKVKNQSKFTKKYIKIRVAIFDQDKIKIAEKGSICGRMIGREDLKNQPAEFFKGEMVIKPEVKEEMVIPPGQNTPFMVIFEDPPSKGKEFKVEIVEAPNL